MRVERKTDLKRFYVSSYKNQVMESKYAVATINKKINSLQAFNLFLIDRRLTTEQRVLQGKKKSKERRNLVWKLLMSFSVGG